MRAGLIRSVFFVVLLCLGGEALGGNRYYQSDGPDGIVAIEAEHFCSKTTKAGHTWTLTSEPTGFSGSGAMLASPDDNSENCDVDEGPRLNFEIYFCKTGTHYLWVRGYGIDDGDTCHADLDGQNIDSCEELEFERDKWNWVNQADDGPAIMNIEKPGLHTVSIVMREDGLRVDKILLTTNKQYVPEGTGPGESQSGGLICFKTGTSEAIEKDQTIRIPVVLVNGKNAVYTVDYSVSGGTADAADCKVEAGTLRFAPGEREKYIDVRIINDGVDEDDETVVLTLSNATGPNAQLGDPARHTHTIIDPRPKVGFKSATSSEFEQTGNARIPVVLSVAYVKPVTVWYRVVGGTATGGGVDYSLQAGKVRFEPGQLRRDIDVAITADDKQEGLETVELTLWKAVNAKLSSPTRHSFYICERTYRDLQGAYYFRFNSGQRWEKYAKVGEHADAMVRLGDGDDRLVFWRGSSYLPFLDTANGKHFVEVVVPQHGDGEGLMFDKTNKHSHIRIVENSPARAIVEWRYVPDFDKKDLQWWTEEYFTVYPDGVCCRSIHTGTETLEEYKDPSHAKVQQLLLTSAGICALPASWARPIEFDIDQSSAGSYVDLGYDRTRRHYALQARSAGAPAKLRLVVASDASDPALFVKSWGDASVKVTVNGQTFENFKVGYAAQMNNDDLVLWLEGDFKKGTRLAVEPVGGSGPVARRPAPDPYKSEIPDFPKGSPDPGPFGAYYTTLKYWKLWDEPWRVGDYADIVVQFDQSADRLVFWRGTTYVPSWSNEDNHWYMNEFCERRGGDSGLDGLCEPMQDHDSKFSNVRIIQSSPARAIVHWRYSPVTLDGQIPFVDETGWGDCVDDYYFVYPDETCVRYTTLYTSRPNVFHEWHEAIPLVNPGTIPEDVLEMKALSMANLEGDAKVLDFTNGFPPDSELEDGYPIILIGLKGNSKPFAICESAGQWLDPISRPGDTRFNHYDDWPAWPKKYRRNDWERDETGYRVFWKFLPSHSSLMHLNWDNYESNYDGPIVYLRRVLLNGMTPSSDVNTLVPLARYWENPPLVKVTGYGFSGALFDKAQKAYTIRRRVEWDQELVNRDDDKNPNPDADKVNLEILASPRSPLVNPCFIIENWPEAAKAALYINGRRIPEGADFRQGIEKNWKQWQAESSLVVWVRYNTQEKVSFGIEMVK